jgi:hypothetical protein
MPITLTIDHDANRVRLTFEAKPSEQIRTEMKRRGFRWDSARGSWSVQLTGPALSFAKQLAEGKAPAGPADAAALGAILAATGEDQF